MGRKAVYTNEFKHEVCQFYEHHSRAETMTKYGITSGTLWKWRTQLGYRNKHIGYNNHTEMLQPVAKRERRNFMVTRNENGQLQGELMEIKLQYAVLERKFEQLKETILGAIK